MDKEHDKIKILQFGEGNFLRAFVDWMVDEADEQGVLDAKVAVVTPRFSDNAASRVLKDQEGKYNVILEGVENGLPKREIRRIRCIADVMAPSLAPDMERYHRLIESPALRFVVSNTTEAGIRFEHDDVMCGAPKTFPGKIVDLLWRRYNAFSGAEDKGLIFLPCELIEDNGSKLREFVLRHAEAAELPAEFIAWIKSANIFADTLVDRIVPGYPKDDIEAVWKEIGYDDHAVVKGELYNLWVIGGKDYKTIQQEFPLDKAGLNVLFMPSVKEIRDRKVRILNGSHTGMVSLSLLLGLETVKEAFDDVDVNRFVIDMVSKEVLPVIEGDKKELERFAGSILERFYNPYMKHCLKSIALNSLSKWEARNFDTVQDNYSKFGRYAVRELFTFAALLALYAPDSSFKPEDNPDYVAKIKSVWNSDDYVQTVRDIVGSDIFTVNFEAAVPGFSVEVGRLLGEIKRDGIRMAMTNLIKD